MFLSKKFAAIFVPSNTACSGSCSNSGLLQISVASSTKEANELAPSTMKDVSMRQEAHLIKAWAESETALVYFFSSFSPIFLTFLNQTGSEFRCQLDCGHDQDGLQYSLSSACGENMWRHLQDVPLIHGRTNVFGVKEVGAEHVHSQFQARRDLGSTL